MNRPNIEFIVISSWGKLLLVKWPLQSTHLLLMVLEIGKVVILLSEISVKNALVFRART